MAATHQRGEHTDGPEPGDGIAHANSMGNHPNTLYSRIRGILGTLAPQFLSFLRCGPVGRSGGEVGVVRMRCADALERLYRHYEYRVMSRSGMTMDKRRKP